MATSQYVALRASCSESDDFRTPDAFDERWEAPIRHPELAALKRMWEEARSGRALPSRRDFSPERLRPWLGSLALIDVGHDPILLRYRLVGTHIVDNFKFDPTGKALGDLVADPVTDSMTEGLYRCLVLARPVFEVVQPRYQRHYSFRCHRLALPLSGDGLTVNMIMLGEYVILPRGAPIPMGHRDRPRLTASV